MPLLDIGLDKSYPELFQYLKFSWFAYLSLVLAVRRNEKAFLPMAIVFLILFAFDAFRLHESYGNDVASLLTIEPVLGLRLQDYGELIVMLGLAVTSIMVWLSSYFLCRVDQRYIVVFSGKMLLLFGIFGAAVDMLHEMMSRVGKTAYFFVGTIEDGGEMLVLSMLVGSFTVYSLASAKLSRP